MNDDTLNDHAQQQLEYNQRWLKLAPEPPERGENSYDVFISYRSADRPWAMALYDALKLAGWEPFLDQYELVPGANLERSLIEALEASSSGVILWSSRTKDSKWCERERNAMRSLQDDTNNFSYVFAKLDSEKLPLFARSDLYIDFKDSPEGPRGEMLLRVMYGMKGMKLPPEAVEMAQQVDQDAKAVLKSINGAIEGDNPDRLFEIGTSAKPGVLASPTPILTAAQGLISMGEYDQAREVLKYALVYFPKSVRAKQLEGLALRRLGKYQDAIDVLSELKAAGHQDPETMGILAAAWDGRYQESQKTLHLRKSRELYRTAFQADSKDFYTGINAASKSLFLGETEETERLAAEVLKLVKDASDGENFWAACTLGEIYLLQRKFTEATALFQRIIDKHFSKAGDLKGTFKQARRICEKYELTEEDMQKVLRPFQLLEEG